MVDDTPFRQFAILMYKGLLLRKRHYIVTVFEVIIPIMIAVIPVIIMSESARPQDRRYEEISDQYRKESGIWINYTTYDPFDPRKPPSIYTRDTYFVYAPSNPITDQFMNDTLTRYHEKSDFNVRNVIGLKSEAELEVYSSNKQRGDWFIKIVGTVFNNIEDGPVYKLPDSLDYKIRYGGGYFNTKLKYRVNGPQYSTEYKTTYFLSWQNTIEETFIEHKMKENNVKMDYKVWMQRFPYPEHIDTRNALSVITFVPWCFVCGYLIFIINIVRRVIEEKSNGSKELLKMMGMTDCVYWTSTFTNYFIVAFFTTLVITIVYKLPLKYSYVFIRNMNFFLLFIMLLIFMASLVLFCMAFSIFFKKHNRQCSIQVVVMSICILSRLNRYFVVTKL